MKATSRHTLQVLHDVGPCTSDLVADIHRARGLEITDRAVRDHLVKLEKLGLAGRRRLGGKCHQWRIKPAGERELERA